MSTARPRRPRVPSRPRQGRRANTCGHRRADDAKCLAHEHPAAHSPPPHGAQTPPETEREALVALYNATGGPNWEGNNNWLSDVPISEWEGVTTDDNGRVTQLNLSWNQLSGEIPAELDNLANLERLRLDGNELSGEIPPQLGNLASLTWLSLGGTQLSGEIPPELGNLAKLIGMNLSENHLRGCVPNSLLGRLDMGSSDLN